MELWTDRLIALAISSGLVNPKPKTLSCLGLACLLTHAAVQCSKRVPPSPLLRNTGTSPQTEAFGPFPGPPPSPQRKQGHAKDFEPVLQSVSQHGALLSFSIDVHLLCHVGWSFCCFALQRPMPLNYAMQSSILQPTCSAAVHHCTHAPVRSVTLRTLHGLVNSNAAVPTAVA